MNKKEYEWTGKVTVWQGQAHKRGEVLLLTDAEAIEYLAFGAVEPKDKSSSRPAEKSAEKPRAVKTDGR